MSPPSRENAFDSIPLTREEIQEGYDTSLLSLPERNSSSTSTRSYSSTIPIPIPPIHETMGSSTRRKAAEGYEKRAREIESRKRLLGVSVEEGEDEEGDEERNTKGFERRRRRKLVVAVGGFGVLVVVGIVLGIGLGLGLFGKGKGKEGEGEGKESVSAKVEVSSASTEGSTSEARTSEAMWTPVPSSWEPTPVETTVWTIPENEATAMSEWGEVVPAQQTSAIIGGSVVGEGWEEAGEGVTSWNTGETGSVEWA